jgi:hypothetical protein
MLKNLASYKINSLDNFLHLLAILFSLIIAKTAYGQMTLPSVFPDMKSVNPAVISLRKSGMVKLSAAQDKIERKQKITNLSGTAFPADQKDDITITNINLFKGGKGGGTTTEWVVDYTVGKQKTNFVTPTETTNENQTATAYYGKYAWGFGSKWGLQIHYLHYQSNFKYSVEYLGDTQSDEIDMTISMPGIRVGKIIGSPSLSFGLIAELNAFSNKTNTSDTSIETEEAGFKPLPIIGIAIGSGSPKGLLELGLEIDARPPEEDLATGEKASIPFKASFIAERRFGKLILGYKGMYYRGNFLDFDRVIPIQLVYQGAGDEGRIENVFNFSFGPDKGFSMGGSIFASNTKTKEKSSVFTSENKHDTQTKLFGISIRMGYVY